MSLPKAVRAIENQGMLLVYPIHNQPDPPSLWSALYPRSKMRWEWTDDTGDDRVADLWHLRMELSTSKKVVYGKWFQNRATFLSKDYFTALYTLAQQKKAPLSRDAHNTLELMLETSPLSTRQLKAGAGLQGKSLESTFQKAMKELWQNFLIVGFGEVDDGAFPSLAVGASRHLFENLCERNWSKEEALSILETQTSPKFLKYLKAIKG